MTPEEIHSKLANSHGDAILPWLAPEHGDPCIQVAPEGFRAVAESLRHTPDLAFDFLRCVTGVDREASLSSVYHLYSYTHEHGVTLRVDVARDEARLPSVSDLWPAADWHERETYDMMGIEYEGHPGLRRILLPSDWEGFPLRKDYVPPKTYNGLTNE